MARIGWLFGRGVGGPRRVMAISSSGGHLIQLKRLLPAFADCEVIFVSTERVDAHEIAASRRYCVRNATRRESGSMLIAVWQIFRILFRERPEVVVTTGAAPGVLALALAKVLLRSRTVWVDSLSQSESMTLSGRIAKPFADAWLVQWEHLARSDGPQYWGSVWPSVSAPHGDGADATSPK